MVTMREIVWKPIEGTEGYYYISNTGLVLSKHRLSLLSPSINRYGYEKVELSVRGKKIYKTVHRLVAEAFINNPLDLPNVIHINEIKTDNRVENLEWASVETNHNRCKNKRKTAGGYRWRYAYDND